MARWAITWRYTVRCRLQKEHLSFNSKEETTLHNKENQWEGAKLSCCGMIREEEGSGHWERGKKWHLQKLWMKCHVLCNMLISLTLLFRNYYSLNNLKFQWFTKTKIHFFLLNLQMLSMAGLSLTRFLVSASLTFTYAIGKDMPPEYVLLMANGRSSRRQLSSASYLANSSQWDMDINPTKLGRKKKWIFTK